MFPMSLRPRSHSFDLRDSKSVRLSVCNVPVSDENGLKYRHSFFHSSFTSIKHLHEIPTGAPPAGALNTGGVFKKIPIRLS